MQYQTQQGVVYAAAPTSAAMSAIPEGYVLNLPQSSTLQLQGESQQTGRSLIWVNIGSSNGLLPVQQQIITWTSVGFLLMRPLQTSLKSESKYK